MNRSDKICFFDVDGFDFDTVRVTKNNEASVIDIIKIATMDANPCNLWRRLDTTDIAKYCSTIKFSGSGQRLTSVVSAKGVVLLLKKLPGPKAIAFREKCAETLIRFLSSDASLVDEVKDIEENVNIPGQITAFYKKSVGKLVRMSEPMHFYLRGYNEDLQNWQTNSIIDTKSRKFSYNIIKIGKTSQPHRRNCEYGEDFGHFYFSIQLSDKSFADRLESIYKTLFHDYKWETSFEYFDAVKLAKFFRVISTDVHSIDKEQYSKVMELFWNRVLDDLRSMESKIVSLQYVLKLSEKDNSFMLEDNPYNGFVMNVAESETKSFDSNSENLSLIHKFLQTGEKEKAIELLRECGVVSETVGGVIEKNEEYDVYKFLRHATFHDKSKSGLLFVDLYPVYSQWVLQNSETILPMNKTTFCRELRRVRIEYEYGKYIRVPGKTGGGQGGIKFIKWNDEKKNLLMSKMVNEEPNLS